MLLQLRQRPATSSSGRASFSSFSHRPSPPLAKPPSPPPSLRCPLASWHTPSAFIALRPLTFSLLTLYHLWLHPSLSPLAAPPSLLAPHRRTSPHAHPLLHFGLPLFHAPLAMLASSFDVSLCQPPPCSLPPLLAHDYPHLGSLASCRHASPLASPTLSSFFLTSSLACREAHTPRVMSAPRTTFSLHSPHLPPPLPPCWLRALRLRSFLLPAIPAPAPFFFLFFFSPFPSCLTPSPFFSSALLCLLPYAYLEPIPSPRITLPPSASRTYSHFLCPSLTFQNFFNFYFFKYINNNTKH